jgi:hypothetical protein
MPPRPITIKAPRGGHKKEIRVLGHRDPRGPDNNIFIWVDKEDKLHIQLYKTDRCYKFLELVETGSVVELIAN